MRRRRRRGSRIWRGEIVFTVNDAGWNEIWLMAADGSLRKRLTEVGPPENDAAGNMSPAWSPDGKAGSLVVPTLVLAEASYLVRKALGASGEAALLRAASRGEFRLALPTASDLGRLGEASVATLDRRHVTVVRPAHVEAFTLLP